MPVTRIQNAYYVARNMNATVAFYHDALGLKLKFQDGERWAQFDAGGGNFSLASADEAPLDAGGGVVVFEVTEIETMADRIAAAGGEVLGRRDMGGHGRTLTFRDPAGNVLQLFERAAKA
ncbi:MAG TPA: VOC family protein [Xanthobacteraceae bacterium]|nr:VOC family protein [Xanthobacteraceae bacterium]